MLVPHCLYADSSLDWAKSQEQTIKHTGGGRKCIAMKRKFNPFRAKAIETRYDGYHFRSRLEARWAMFFNTAGIKYEYEKEGFDLEGTWYLPDFWLPEQDCWIEIKGQEPTYEEQDKASKLSIWTQKHVGLFYGNIQPPDTSLRSRISRLYEPVSLWTHPRSETMPTPQAKPVQTPSYILALLQGLVDCGLELEAGEQDEEIMLIINTRPVSYAVDDSSMELFISRLQNQQEAIKRFHPVLEEHEEEIMAILTPANGWKMHFERQYTGLEEHCFWAECDHCNAMELATIFSAHTCDDGQIGNFLFDSPRLQAAFKAAREARF